MSESNGFPWPALPLKTVAAEMCLGKMLDKQKNRGTLQPYLRNVNVRWFTFDLSDMKEMRFEADDEIRFGLQPGDLVVCEGGEPGRAAVWKGQAASAKIQKALHRIRFRAEDYDPSFAMYYLYYGTITNRFAPHYTGTTIKHLTGKALSRVEFPVPPLNEQRRIVEKIEELFSDLDAGVAALERAKANLKRYRASVLKAAVERKLTAAWRAEHKDVEPTAKLLERILAERRRKWEADQLAKFAAAGKSPPKNWRAKYVEPAPPDTSNLPALPNGWCWASVEQLGHPGEQAALTGPFGSTLGREDFVPEGVPLLTIGCLAESGVKLDKAFYITDEKAESLSRYRIETGDLLFSRSASVGRVGYVTDELSGSLINYHLMRLRLAKEVLYPLYFVSYVRGAAVVTAYLRKVNHGATRDGINTESLLGMPVALPTAEEQVVIVQEVEERLSLVRAAEQQIGTNETRAARLRQSILKRAFEGELVPQDPRDEPANALLERIEAAGSDNVKPGRTRRPRKVSKTNESI